MYRLQNRQGQYLNAFYPNAAGESVKSVFECSLTDFTFFHSEQEANEYLEYIKRTCQERAKQWQSPARILEFPESLRIEEDIS